MYVAIGRKLNRIMLNGWPTKFMTLFNHVAAQVSRLLQLAFHSLLYFVRSALIFLWPSFGRKHRMILFYFLIKFHLSMNLRFFYFFGCDGAITVLSHYNDIIILIKVHIDQLPHSKFLLLLGYLAAH